MGDDDRLDDLQDDERRDEGLQDRLQRLRPQVDAEVGLRNVAHEAARRRRRDRALAAAAVLVVLVLLGGAVFGRGRSGNEAEVVAAQPGTTAPDRSAPPGPSSVPDNGTVTTPGTEPDTTIVTTPDTTVPGGPTASTTVPSLPPITPSTTPGATPTSTGTGAADVELSLTPTVSSVRPGDQLFVDVAVINRGTGPAGYEGNFCSAGPASLIAGDRVQGQMPSQVGAEWDADPDHYAQMVAGNGFDNLDPMVRDELIDDPDGAVCVTVGIDGHLAPGQTLTGRLAWNVRLAPGGLASGDTIVVSGRFTYGSASTGGIRNLEARATATVGLVDDARRSTTGAAAYRAAATDGTVASWLHDRGTAPSKAMLWFGRDEWVFVVTAAPTRYDGDSAVVVRVDPETSAVKSSTVVGAQLLPRI